MRRLLVVLVCAGCVRLVTLDAAATGPRDRSEVVSTVAVQRGGIIQVRVSHEMGMVLVGTALIGVASLLRRAV